MKKAFAALAATIALMAPGVAAAASPFPVGPPNQPVTYGDCVSTTAAGEGVEDYTVEVREFTQLVKPPNSQRPGDLDAFACKGFSPP